MAKTIAINSKILLLCLIILGLTGCDSSQQKQKLETTPNPDRKYWMATLVKVDGIPVFARMRIGVEKFARETGQDAFMLGPARADGALQAQMIDDLVEQGVNAICIVPFSVAAVKPALERAREKGIIVVAQEACQLDSANVILEPFDNKAWGRHLMDELATYMKQRGAYAIILGSYGSESHVQWRDAAVAHQRAKYPNMKLITDAIEDYDNPARAYAGAQGLLNKFPEIRGILGLTMVSCPSSALAVETLGLQDKVSVVGVSLVSACKSYLESGSIKEISFWDPAEAGYAMNEIALKLLQGQEIDAGMKLRAKGYGNLRRDKSKSNIFFGQGWIDVTKKNMSNYPY